MKKKAYVAQPFIGFHLAEIQRQQKMLTVAVLRGLALCSDAKRALEIVFEELES